MSNKYKVFLYAMSGKVVKVIKCGLWQNKIFIYLFILLNFFLIIANGFWSSWFILNIVVFVFSIVVLQVFGLVNYYKPSLSVIYLLGLIAKNIHLYSTELNKDHDFCYFVIIYILNFLC